MDDHRFEWGIWDDHEPEHVESSEADKRLFEIAIRENPYVAECDKDGWTYAVRDGNEIPLIAIALTKLPNLISERLPAHGELFFTINQMIAPLIPFYSTGIPETLPSSRNQPTSPLMPNLTYVWVEPGFNPENPETFIDGGAIEAFAALPSVKVINGYRFGGGEEDVELAEPLENSHATTLNLSAAIYHPSECFFSWRVLRIWNHSHTGLLHEQSRLKLTSRSSMFGLLGLEQRTLSEG